MVQRPAENLYRQFLDGSSGRKLQQVGYKWERTMRLVFALESSVASDTLHQQWRSGRLELEHTVQGTILDKGVLVVEEEVLY